MRTDCLLIQCKFRCVLTLRFLQLFPANLLPFPFQALKVLSQCKLHFPAVPSGPPLSAADGLRPVYFQNCCRPVRGILLVPAARPLFLHCRMPYHGHSGKALAVLLLLAEVLSFFHKLQAPDRASPALFRCGIIKLIPVSLPA